MSDLEPKVIGHLIAFPAWSSVRRSLSSSCSCRTCSSRWCEKVSFWIVVDWVKKYRSLISFLMIDIFQKICQMNFGLNSIKLKNEKNSPSFGSKSASTSRSGTAGKAGAAGSPKFDRSKAVKDLLLSPIYL